MMSTSGEANIGRFSLDQGDRGNRSEDTIQSEALAALQRITESRETIRDDGMEDREAERRFQDDIRLEFRSPEEDSFEDMFPSFGRFPPPLSWFRALSKFSINMVCTHDELDIKIIASIKYMMSLKMVLKHVPLSTDILLHFFVQNPSFKTIFKENIGCISSVSPSFDDQFTRRLRCTPFQDYNMSDWISTIKDLGGMVMAYYSMTMRMSRFHLCLQTQDFSTAIMKDLLEGGVEDAAEFEMAKTPVRDAQKLLQWLVNEAAKMSLRRTEEGFYRPKILENGFFCFYYEYYLDFEKFIWKTVGQRATNADMFDALTSGQKVTSELVSYLQKMEDPRIPWIEQDRRLFAARNGMIDGKYGVVYTFTDIPVGLNREKILPISALDKSRTACNYFDHDIDLEGFSRAMDAGDPLMIRTPNMDSILDSQGYTREDKLWQYGMIGRMVFPLNEGRDEWQVFTYIYGLAGTGKSTFIDIQTAMYRAASVQRIMAESSSDFKDENILKDNVYIIFHPDVDNNCKYPESSLRILIDGDWQQVNRKGKPSVSVRVNCHIIMGSNVMPPFKDDAGNLVRRVFIFEFANPVTGADGQLKKKCLQNYANILLKNISCYHLLADKYGNNSNLHSMNILPPMLQRTRKKHLHHVSPISRFLEDKDFLEFDPSFSLEYQEFQSALSDYVSSKNVNSLRGFKLDSVAHATIFKLYNCTFAINNGYIDRINGLRLKISI